MTRHYAHVAERAGHRCEYCHAPEAIFNFPFEVEHILPGSQGGPDEPENLCLACRSCNLFKSDHTTGTLNAANSAIPLFHPRLHRWDDHFEANLATGLIVGTTDIGKATVERLQMNGRVQRTARIAWIKLGLFR